MWLFSLRWRLPVYQIAHEGGKGNVEFKLCGQASGRSEMISLMQDHGPGLYSSVTTIVSQLCIGYMFNFVILILNILLSPPFIEMH